MGTASGSSCKHTHTHTHTHLGTAQYKYILVLLASDPWSLLAAVLTELTSFVQFKPVSSAASCFRSCRTPNILIQAPLWPLNPHKYLMTVCLCCVRKTNVAVLNRAGCSHYFPARPPRDSWDLSSMSHYTAVHTFESIQAWKNASKVGRSRCLWMQCVLGESCPRCWWVAENTRQGWVRAEVL